MRQDETMTTIDEYIAALEEPLASIAKSLRSSLDKGLPELTAAVWHGHPVWMRDRTPIAGFKAYPRYVTVMLWRGGEIVDPTGQLMPAGTGQMTAIRYRSVGEIDHTQVVSWLMDVAALEN
jgi:hypothetical protein